MFGHFTLRHCFFFIRHTKTSQLGYEKSTNQNEDFFPFFWMRIFLSFFWMKIFLSFFWTKIFSLFVSNENSFSFCFEWGFFPFVLNENFFNPSSSWFLYLWAIFSWNVHDGPLSEALFNSWNPTKGRRVLKRKSDIYVFFPLIKKCLRLIFPSNHFDHCLSFFSSSLLLRRHSPG